MKEKKKNTLIPILLTIGATGIYHAVKGKGVFNKPRFAKQHNAISKYVETHYPGGSYAPIHATQNGWATVITGADGSKHNLYVGKTPDGVYVFKEF